MNKIEITLPEETLKSLGIDEETAIESYFKDGKIVVNILDDDDLDSLVETDDDDDDDEDDIPEECFECQYFCWKNGICTRK